MIQSLFCCCRCCHDDKDDDEEHRATTTTSSRSDEEETGAEAASAAAETDSSLTTPLLPPFHFNNDNSDTTLQEEETSDHPLSPHEKKLATNGKSKKRLGEATQRWEDMFAALLKYIQEEQERALRLSQQDDSVQGCKRPWDGIVHVESTANPNKALGHWVHRQRLAQQKGRLKPERQERLTKIGLQWTL